MYRDIYMQCGKCSRVYIVRAADLYRAGNPNCTKCDHEVKELPELFVTEDKRWEEA